MTDWPDIKLLQEYAARGSQEAFALLVQRHIRLVYSVAWRQLGNVHQAEEITQAVFIILAKKAEGFPDKAPLAGWLYETARLTTANFRRSEQRRFCREQEAFMQAELNESNGPQVWETLAPLLDEAMGCLGAAERHAIVARYFEGRTFAEAAIVLGEKEAAVQKRVSRAVEKLRSFFARRGLKISASILIGTITANSLQAAPGGLALAVTSTAVAKGATATTATSTLVKGALKIMAWTKIKTAVVIGVCALVVTATTTLVLEKRAAHTNGMLKTVLQIDWKKLSERGELLGGELYNAEGSTILKISETNKSPRQWTIFKIKNPPVTASHYAITGEVSYEAVPQDSQLAIWNYFPPLTSGGQEAQFYSYTGELEGPAQKIRGSSAFRPFSLTMDRITGNQPGNTAATFDPRFAAKAPSHIDVQVFQPGGGTIYLRNLRLVEWTEPMKLSAR